MNLSQLRVIVGGMLPTDSAINPHKTTRMWVNAQRHGHPAKCRWRPLFNAANFG